MFHLGNLTCVDVLLRTRPNLRFTSAAVVTALETAWATIRTHHPEIPPAVIIVAGSSSTGNHHNAMVYGHFAALRWQHHHRQLSEVLISGEGLNRPATDVLTTLLHEATHALAFTRGIKDTSRQGRWHNQRFATLADELGLDTIKGPKYGWSICTLRPDTTSRYTTVLAGLRHALTAYRHLEPHITKPPATPSSVAACCHCPLRIRVTATVLEQGSITCGICDTDFTTDQTGDPS